MARSRELRDDLLSGELPLHLFAADLYEVMMQNGKRPVYEKPEEFFAPDLPRSICAISFAMLCCGWQGRMTRLFASWN